MSLNMIELDAPQGSPKWKRDRRSCWNASETSALMGISPYMTRDQVLYALHTKTDPEVSPEQQARFDEGHRTEALARPIAEGFLGKTLFPVVGRLPVGTYGVGRFPMGASYDGVPITQRLNFECKQLNADLREALPVSGWEGLEQNDAKKLPKYFRVQMQQQVMVCLQDGQPTFERVLFMAAEFNGEKLGDFRVCWFYPDPVLADEIIRTLQVADADLENYVVPDVKPPAPKGTKMTSMPALLVEVVGQVVDSNLADWRDAAIAKIASIRTELVTDQDFADAGEAVKWCEASKVRLQEVKAQCLAKMATVEQLFEAIDAITNTMDEKRKNLSTLIASRRAQRVREIIAKGEEAQAKHHQALEQQLRDLLPESTRITGNLLPLVGADFQKAVHGKRSFTSMESGVNDAVAAWKVECNRSFEPRQKNIRAFVSRCEGKMHLFTDWRELIGKDVELVDLTIGQRLKAEEDRIAAEAEKKRQADDAAARQREADAQRLAQPEDTCSAPAGAPTVFQTTSSPPVYGAASRDTSLTPDGDLVYTGGATIRGPLRRETYRGADVVDQVPQGRAILPPAPGLPTAPTLKAGDVNARLGFTMTLEFIEKVLKQTPTVDGTKKLFSEAQVDAMLFELQQRIEVLRLKARTGEAPAASDPDEIAMQPVRSGQIKAVGYHDGMRVLAVEFNSGGSYRYDGVPPDEFSKLLQSSSIGSYFTTNIRGKFASRKVEA
jgi:predicted phage-related endonuclease